MSVGTRTMTIRGAVCWNRVLLRMSWTFICRLVQPDDELDEEDGRTKRKVPEPMTWEEQVTTPRVK